MAVIRQLLKRVAVYNMRASEREFDHTLVRKIVEKVKHENASQLVQHTPIHRLLTAHESGNPGFKPDKSDCSAVARDRQGIATEQNALLALSIPHDSGFSVLAGLDNSCVSLFVSDGVRRRVATVICSASDQRKLSIGLTPMVNCPRRILYWDECA